MRGLGRHPNVKDKVYPWKVYLRGAIFSYHKNEDTAVRKARYIARHHPNLTHLIEVVSNDGLSFMWPNKIPAWQSLKSDRGICIHEKYRGLCPECSDLS